jgi:predicted CoA-binding protein
MNSVLILGASSDRNKFGNKALRAYLRRSFNVYPVNPKVTVIEGVTVYPSIEAVPVRPSVVTVYVPSKVLLGLLPAVAAKGCDELWLNPGTESPEVLAEAQRLGLKTIQACSILGLGLSPEEF